MSLSSQPCAQEHLGPCSQSMAGLGTALEHLPAECRHEHHFPGPENARPSWVSRPNFPSPLGSDVGHGDAGAGGLGGGQDTGPPAPRPPRPQ